MLVLVIAVSAQQSKPPFRQLDEEVKKQRAGWAGSKQELAAAFNAERVRLGDKFEEQLIKYLGNDIDKHYWVSAFLEAPSYLHGNKRLPHLALLIKQQALSLLRGKTDEESLADTVRLSVTAAILSEDLGLHALADAHKHDVEKILAADSNYSAAVPGMDEYDRCLYGSVGTERRTPCRKDVAQNRSPIKPRISGGILNGKAISKPAPAYPEEAKAQGVSGVVTVEVVIDEDGRVEFARGVSGHPLLQEAAVNAARQARFSPTRLSGQPVKVIGILTYNFAAKE
jgi:TonB family protein